jgi:hypothetical protein
MPKATTTHADLVHLRTMGFLPSWESAPNAAGPALRARTWGRKRTKPGRLPAGRNARPVVRPHAALATARAARQRRARRRRRCQTHRPRRRQRRRRPHHCQPARERPPVYPAWPAPAGAREPASHAARHREPATIVPTTPMMTTPTGPTARTAHPNPNPSPRAPARPTARPARQAPSARTPAEPRPQSPARAPEPPRQQRTLRRR